jgi:hypothetical protein
MDQLRKKLMRRSLLAAVTTMIVAACIDGQAATGRLVGQPAVSGVDSILPTEIALARFLHGVARPASLSGGSPGMTDLIERFSEALDHRDSLGLMAMSVTRSEYGYFYYPSSIYVRKPYALPPDVAWLLSSQENAKAVRRLLQRLGGRGAVVRSANCVRTEQQGVNLVHAECSVTVVAGNGSEEVRLFRSVLERDGRMKFLSFAGDF